ncbi:hypothetical protein BCV72DRAFT_39631 [Rhizopus microsporus var. microsporus]|uniref:Uncharacterized protein n=1 Tax=Rhizopus microsporus var. microsporus TaxID=86635 RepID=A0A1X0RDI3_RHIZD|nr:hypothetical protein BCV72DRAFT_39631 [Rhizopus microsporus var. microsporus]
MPYAPQPADLPTHVSFPLMIGLWILIQIFLIPIRLHELLEFDFLTLNQLLFFLMFPSLTSSLTLIDEQHLYSFVS